MGNRREAANVVTFTLTGLIDDNFNENEEEMSSSDVSGSDASESDVSNRIRVNLDGLNMDGIEVGELCDSDDSWRLDSAHELDSDDQNWPEFNLKNDMSNPRLKVGMLFKSKDSLKEAVKQYEEKGKPILTMMEIIRTKIMLLIVKKKEEANKWKGMLCPKIKKKLDVNIKDSLRCVPSHAGGDKYQVECGLGNQHVVDLVENYCSCRNWGLTGIPCMHALAVIHLKDEFPKTYVQTWYTKQTQFQIYSNFIRPVRGSKQWVFLSNMLPILPPTLRRLLGRPTKVRRKEPDEPQTTEMLSKRGVDMRSSKCKIIGHNKRSCKREVGQNILVKRHKIGVHNQVVAPTQQQATPNQQESTPTQ
ncbi:hypothetical protein GOBAR_DD09813 [Gossypium barbadense]|nr:hypothetical protein GOBAR_DD09813 [Gossypium barbadense]